MPKGGRGGSNCFSQDKINTVLEREEHAQRGLKAGTCSPTGFKSPPSETMLGVGIKMSRQQGTHSRAQSSASVSWWHQTGACPRTKQVGFDTLAAFAQPLHHSWISPAPGGDAMTRHWRSLSLLGLGSFLTRM